MKPTVSWIPWRNSDLRSYLRHAQLPEMTFSERAPEPPRDGFKSHLNKLKVTPEHFRQLESIRRMQANQLAENIAASAHPRSLRSFVMLTCLSARRLRAEGQPNRG
jgi:hypothetical protein